MLKMKNSVLFVALILLLGTNADAGFLDSLDKLSKELDNIQKELDNPSTPNSNTEQEQAVAKEQTPAPIFNSLAEEKAYNEQQKALREDAVLIKYQNILLPELKSYNTKRDLYLEKYLIKESDTPEMIDEKYKNRVHLSIDLKKDCEGLRTQEKIINKTIDDNRNDNTTNINYKKLLEAQNLDISDNDRGIMGNYLSFNVHSMTSRGYLYFSDGFLESYESYLKGYENYLKEAYTGYPERVAEKKQREQKEQARQAAQQRIANSNHESAVRHKAERDQEEIERKKVQGICSPWKAKAQKQIYSLDVGDRIYCESGATYTILVNNANTFTVKTGYVVNPYNYIQKSQCVPASLLKSAPSPYCYK